MSNKSITLSNLTKQKKSICLIACSLILNPTYIYVLAWLKIPLIFKQAIFGGKPATQQS